MLQCKINLLFCLYYAIEMAVKTYNYKLAIAAKQFFVLFVAEIMRLRISHFYKGLNP